MKLQLHNINWKIGGKDLSSISTWLKNEKIENFDGVTVYNSNEAFREFPIKKQTIKFGRKSSGVSKQLYLEDESESENNE